tara:strand:- start:43 stop:570 length:528 start_codon:yes stop_codon:yes gene_type:complete
MGTKIGGGMEFISSSGAISNAATVAFTGFDAGKYDHYAFLFQHVIPATDNVVPYGQTSTDTGSSYASTNGNYHTNGSEDAIGLPITGRGAVGSAANEGGVSGFFYLYAPHNTANYTTANSSSINYISTNGGVNKSDRSNSASYRLAAEDVDAIQFLFSSGNIESGEITMFGIVNA